MANGSEEGESIPISWEDLSKKSYKDAEFILDPYIPREGIVLLWGDTSIGKSPLTWSMAAAIGNGTSFFGLPTRESRVYYLELDTPEPSIAIRIKKLPSAKNVWWDFLPPLSIPYVSKEERTVLDTVQSEVCPDVVFVNTLRKVHDLDDKDSRTAKLVYTFFQKQFPQASLVFIHHIRKKPQDPKFVDHSKEGFSGAKNWLNDAQVGLHLEPFTGPKENLRLYHRKSQVSETLNALPLKLEKDGSRLSSPLFEEYLKTYEIMNNPPTDADGVTLMKKDLDYFIAQAIGVSPVTAKRRRLAIEHREFPGTRTFLSGNHVSHLSEDED